MTPDTPRSLQSAVNRFLATLDGSQRTTATFPFESEKRFHWDYVPNALNGWQDHFFRDGLELKQMTEEQKVASMRVVRRALSARGYATAQKIIDLAAVLRAGDGRPANASGTRDISIYDPEEYTVAVFGDPRSDQPWMWRFEGHHVSLHFTGTSEGHLATAPLFLGSSPARVSLGPTIGLRPLAEAEDLGRALVTSLDRLQKERAILSSVAPADIYTRHAPRVDPASVPGGGITFEELNGEQRLRLTRLIKHYLGRLPIDLARIRWAEIEAHDLPSVTFAWAGAEAPGQDHYYAIRSRAFLVEYDNHNAGNHIHSVWRELHGDWGEDLLGAHLAKSHVD